jgi:hypothetical protein
MKSNLRSSHADSFSRSYFFLQDLRRRSMVPTPAQRSTATDNLQCYSARTVRAEVRAVVRGAPDSEQFLSGAAPDCLVPLKDKASNDQKLPNPNGWVTWLAHRTVSGGAPDCPVHPSTAAYPNGLLVVEGYKYPPTTTTTSIQVF